MLLDKEKLTDKGFDEEAATIISKKIEDAIKYVEEKGREKRIYLNPNTKEDGEIGERV